MKWCRNGYCLLLLLSMRHVWLWNEQHDWSGRLLWTETDWCVPPVWTHRSRTTHPFQWTSITKQAQEVGLIHVHCRPMSTF